MTVNVERTAYNYCNQSISCEQLEYPCEATDRSSLFWIAPSMQIHLLDSRSKAGN